MVPQYRVVPALQVSGTQPAVRQTFEVQTWVPVQAPQSSDRPQPSPIDPQ
jgi:hypothetical protein